MTGPELTHIRTKTLLLSKTKLAEALGVNLSTVWRWEKDHLPITSRAEKAIKLLLDAKREDAA